MEHSTFELKSAFSLLSWASLICAILAAAILSWFLLRRPPLVRATKLLLLLGIGLLPIGAAFTGNLVGFEQTMERDFCGSCHTMTPYAADSANPESTSLAALHARNQLFGDRNCYMCHANYGMFGTIATKIGSLSHVWAYFTEYRSMPVQESLRRIRLYKPYPNGSCMHCHSTAIPGWTEVKEHASGSELIRSGELGCTGAGCHGPAHPFSKRAEVSP